WRWPEATLPEALVQVPLYARYGVQAPSGLFRRWMGRDKTDDSSPHYTHDALGYLEVDSAQATLFLKGTAAWSLDLTRPLRVHAYTDRTDTPQTQPPLASVHIVIRQEPQQPHGTWVEAGLSFHVLDSEALDQLPRLRQSFPYIGDNNAQQVLAWIAAWSGRGLR
ncbi:MAG: hypothetical protein AAFS10_25100, partial [Myxococcota bacterium]